MGGSRVKDMWGMGSGGVGSRVGVVGLTLDFFKVKRATYFAKKTHYFAKFLFCSIWSFEN